MLLCAREILLRRIRILDALTSVPDTARATRHARYVGPADKGRICIPTPRKFPTEITDITATSEGR